MRYLRYAWSLLLLAAAVLAPDIPTTVTLAIAGLLTISLAVWREKRMQTLVKDLADTLSFTRPQPVYTVALERTLLHVQRTMLTLVIIAELLIFAAVLFADLDITIARNYALLVLVALAPLGLEAELAALIRGRHTHSSETVRTAVGYATEDARTLLVIIGLSFIGTLWLHIPPALSALQILFITCVARPILSGRALQATQHKTDQIWRVAFTSLVVYGGFLFFFIRHYLDPQFADVTNPVTWQATTVAMLTFIGCQAALLVFNPKAPRAATYRGTLLLTIVIAACYTPFMQSFFMTAGPDAADWAWILIASLVFTSLYVLRIKARTDSRSSVLALHAKSRSAD
jgi:hypothetical protein